MSCQDSNGLPFRLSAAPAYPFIHASIWARPGRKLVSSCQEAMLHQSYSHGCDVCICLHGQAGSGTCWVGANPAKDVLDEGDLQQNGSDNSLHRTWHACVSTHCWARFKACVSLIQPCEILPMLHTHRMRHCHKALAWERQMQIGESRTLARCCGGIAYNLVHGDDTGLVTLHK